MKLLFKRIAVALTAGIAFISLLGNLNPSLTTLRNENPPVQEQRMFTPNSKPVSAVDGKITVKAYCVDINRRWPDNQLTHLIAEDKTEISFTYGNKQMTLQLSRAINEFVTIEANIFSGW